MSDPQPTDYKAEAFAWLGGRIFSGDAVEVEKSLAALLERLCGEAREEGYNKAHAKWIVDYGRAQAELNELREAVAGKAYDPPGRENRNWVEIAQRMRAKELRIRPTEAKP